MQDAVAELSTTTFASARGTSYQNEVQAAGWSALGGASAGLVAVLVIAVALLLCLVCGCVCYHTSGGSKHGELEESEAGKTGASAVEPGEDAAREAGEELQESVPYVTEPPEIDNISYCNRSGEAGIGTSRRAPLEGPWLSSQWPSLELHVEGGYVQLGDGQRAQLTRTSREEVIMETPARRRTVGQLLGGRLHWDSGDVWRRPYEGPGSPSSAGPAGQRRGAAAAPGAAAGAAAPALWFDGAACGREVTCAPACCETSPAPGAAAEPGGGWPGSHLLSHMPTPGGLFNACCVEVGHGDDCGADACLGDEEFEEQPKRSSFAVSSDKAHPGYNSGGTLLAKEADAPHDEGWHAC